MTDIQFQPGAIRSADKCLTERRGGRNCRICGSGSVSHFIAREHFEGTHERFDYFECLLCGCIQIKEFPPSMARFYGSGYGTIHPSGLKQVLRDVMYFCAYSPFDPLAKTMAAFTHGCNYGLMRTLRKLGKEVSILDVGCGSGRLLDSLRRLGINGRLVGLDPFIEKNVTFENGVELRKCAVKEYIDDRMFDAITIMHTFEHIAEQDETLLAVRRLLKPHGVCIITVPIAGSRQWRVFQENWVQLDPPRHFYLHTPKSMLARKNSMNVERVIYDSSSFQFWGTAIVRKGKPLSPMSKSYLRSLWRMPFDMMRATIANWKRYGDQATFVLTRAQRGLDAG